MHQPDRVDALWVPLAEASRSRPCWTSGEWVDLHALAAVRLAVDEVHLVVDKAARSASLVGLVADLLLEIPEAWGAHQWS